MVVNVYSMDHYLGQGYAEKETLAMTSMNLGLGDMNGLRMFMVKTEKRMSKIPLRLPKLMENIGSKKVSIYLHIKQNKFPNNSK